MATTTAAGTAVRARRPVMGVSRVVRRLEHQRRTWMRRDPEDEQVATEIAWRAGVAEGLRLAQMTIKKGV